MKNMGNVKEKQTVNIIVKITNPKKDHAKLDLRNKKVVHARKNLNLNQEKHVIQKMRTHPSHTESD